MSSAPSVSPEFRAAYPRSLSSKPRRDFRYASNVNRGHLHFAIYFLNVEFLNTRGKARVRACVTKMFYVESSFQKLWLVESCIFRWLFCC